MKRTLFVCPLVLFAAFATAAQAGWHHRHAYQAAPAYYAYPAQSPSFAPTIIQSGPTSQNALGDIIIAKLVDKLISGMDKVDILPITKKEESGGGGGTTVIDTTSIRQDLSDIKAAIKDLDARVENANSTLQRHGTEILAIRKAVDELDLTKHLDESSEIGKAAKKVLLNAKSLNEIEAALNDLKFKTAADAYKAAPAPAAGMPDKPIQDLRDALKGLLK